MNNRVIICLTGVFITIGACHTDDMVFDDSADIAAACASDPTPAVAQSTVFFTTLRVDGRYGCSATLIDDSHALTAWHCSPGPLPDDAVLVFAPQYSPDAPTRAALEFLSPGSGSRTDIAVVRFAGGLPPGYQPATLAGATRVNAGTAVIHAGYGQTTWTVNDRGTLRIGLSRFDQAMPDQRLRTSSPNCGLCSGDSGGPDYVAVNGELRLLGVHASGDCASIGISTDVRRYVDWIRSTGAEPRVDTEPYVADPRIEIAPDDVMNNPS